MQLDPQTTLAIIGGAGAAASTIYGGWRWIRGSSFARAVRAFADAPEREAQRDQALADMSSKLDRVQHEITPNHGGSMRDAINRIDQSVGTMQAKQRALDDDRLYFEAGPTGEWMWVSQATARLLGRSITALVGYGWVNAIEPGELAALRQDIASAAAERREMQRPVRMVKGDGETITLNWRMIPIGHDGAHDRNPHGFIGHIRSHTPTGRHQATA